MTAGGGPVRVLAPAKVNLHLEVLGARADGYHEIATLMLAIDLFDEVEARASPSGGVSIEIAGDAATADVPRDERNHAVQGALAVLAEARCTSPGVALRLLKRIPSQAGLGGGSSDAAAAALATRAALGLDVSDEALLRRISEIGSDCAFFLAAGNSGYAACAGRGENVSALPPPGSFFRVAVLVPSVTCPTRQVYEALSLSLSHKQAVSTVPVDVLGPGGFGFSLEASRSKLFNRLEAPATKVEPALLAWRALLDRRGAAHFRLSGSGSAFFGLFADSDSAQSCLDDLGIAAGREGLGLRGSWVCRPAASGAKLVPRSRARN
jgi:4-diphosphocytidyl-2-C-methyl-D-erythritol kinase